MFTTMLESLQELKKNFDSGVTKEFLLWGDVNDYLPVSPDLDESPPGGNRGESKSREYITLRQFLLNWLEKLVDIIVFYDIASGMQFPIAGHEKKFRKLTGFIKLSFEIDDKALAKLPKKRQEEILAQKEAMEEEPEPPLPAEPEETINLVRALMENTFCHKGNYKVALILNHAETLAPSGAADFPKCDRINIVNLRHLATSEAIGRGSLTILITKNTADMHASLRGRGSLIKSVEVPLPQEKERLDFITPVLDKNKVVSKISPAELAHLTGGLSLREIENILLLEKTATVQIISREKKRLVEEELHGIVKISEPRWGLDKGLGGLEHIKDFMRKLKPHLLNCDPLRVPPAIMLAGPPGTGKDALAEAVAWEWGVPFVEILNNLSMWHGESERITLQIWSLLTSLYPCVLFINEFDQSEASRGYWQGDSGVQGRLRSMRFKITSDPRYRGKLLVFYATNRPDLIDIADKRSGRASVRIAMILPDVEEMEKIYRIIPEREGFKTAGNVDFARLAKLTREKHGNYISGADIVEISIEALRASERDLVTEKDYLYALDDFIPHHYSATEIKKWEELAVQECSNKRLLSKRGWEIKESLQQKTDQEKPKSKLRSQVV